MQDNVQKLALQQESHGWKKLRVLVPFNKEVFPAYEK